MASNMDLQTFPISGLLSEIFLSPMIQFSQSSDSVSQSKFQWDETINLDNRNIVVTEDNCTRAGNQYSSILDNSKDLQITEESLMGGMEMSETMDWLTKNMNFESANMLTDKFEDFSPLLGLSDELVSNATSQLEEPSNCLHAIPDSATDSLLKSFECAQSSGSAVFPHITENVSAACRSESINTSIPSVSNTSSSLSADEDETNKNNAKKISSSLASKKYWDMRQKNNIASQRSRKIRKLKDDEMVDKLKKLEVENKELSLLAEKLEKQKDALQKYLLQIISK